MILLKVKKDALQVADFITANEMRFLKWTTQRRRDFVVAGAIRLKVIFFLAYRGRHPQSVEAIVAGIPIHSEYCGLFSGLPKALVKRIRRIHLFNIYSYFSNLTLCKRKAFNTTDTELNAIAAPATQGASNPIAAIGIPTVL